MTVTIEQIEKWMATPSENEHLEFKEARNRFDFEKLVGYCVALANEGGGHMILGVTDKLPRQVVGTAAFENPERTKAGLLERLHLRIFKEVLASFTTKDFLLLDFIHKEENIPQEFTERIPRLLDLGVVVRAGKGRYVLSKRFYSMTGAKGVYTRKKGLDRDTNKALLLKHIKENKKTGSRFQEFMQVLPSLTVDEVKTLIKEMKKDGEIHVVGRTRGARWFPGTD